MRYGQGQYGGGRVQPRDDRAGRPPHGGRRSARGRTGRGRPAGGGASRGEGARGLRPGLPGDLRRRARGGRPRAPVPPAALALLRPVRAEQRGVARHRAHQLRVDHAQFRTEQGGQRRPRGARLHGDDLAQHPEQLLGHLLRGREPLARVGVGGADQQPVERLVLPEDLDLVRVGQAVHEDVGVALEVEGQHGEGARHRVEVGGDRRADLGDLGGLVADRAVYRRLRVVHPPDRAHVDEFEPVLGLDRVVHLEVAVQQVAAVQVAEGVQRLDGERDGLRDRQRRALPVRQQPLARDLLERLAADVLHHDVAVEGAGALVEVLDEVVDPHDVGVLDLGEEAPLGDGRGQRVLVPGVQQALEHHPAVGDRAVHREVDPAEPAVREAALHVVLPVHDVALAQLGREGVRVPALGAVALGTAGPALPAAADRRPAVALAAEPLALGHLGVDQHRGRRVRARDGRHGDQPRAELAAGRAAAAAAGAAHRHRAAGGGAGQPLGQPARHRAAGRLRGGPRRARGRRAGGPRGVRARARRGRPGRPGPAGVRPRRRPAAVPARTCRSTALRRPCPPRSRRSRAVGTCSRSPPQPLPDAAERVVMVACVPGPAAAFRGAVRSAGGHAGPPRSVGVRGAPISATAC